jgi:hypothetical protein
VPSWKSDSPGDTAECGSLKAATLVAHRLVLCALIAVGGFGCVAEPPPERRFVNVQMDTVFILGTAEDSILQRPARLRPWRDGVLVIDTETSRVTAVDGGGRVAWNYHRPGRGPNELTAPSDAFADPDGSVVVVDMMARRLLALTSTGTAVSSVQMADLDVGWISQIGPLGSGQAIVHGTGSAGVRVIDLDRMVALERLPLERSVQPPPGFRGDLVVATDQADGRWAVAMRFGPDWWIRGPDGRPVRREMIHRPAHALRSGSRTVSEDVRIAGPVDPSRHGAYSLSLHEGGFSILTGGGWGGVSEPNDIIDLYDHNGTYCGSLRIPFDAMDHVWQGDVLVALRTSPHPSLVAVRTHRSPCVAG